MASASSLRCFLVEAGMVELVVAAGSRNATNLEGDTSGDQFRICWLELVDWRFHGSETATITW